LIKTNNNNNIKNKHKTL